MEKTNIEYFNYYLGLFVANVYDVFPEYSVILKEYYKEVLESDTCNNDKYVKRFMSKLKDYKKQISSKDDGMFGSSLFVLKNIDFCDLWKSEELSSNNKEKIWEYLQTLYILGETIISDSDKIKNIVQKFKQNELGEKVGEGEAEAEAGAGAEAENTSVVEELDNSEDDEILDMLKNLTSDNSEHIDEDFINNGLLGNLAKELTEEIDLSSMNLDENGNVGDIFSNLLSGDNQMNFMNLVQTVGNKIQQKVQNGQFSQSDLMQDAQRMMAGLKNNQAGGMPAPPSNPTRDRLRKKLEERKQQK